MAMSSRRVDEQKALSVMTIFDRRFGSIVLASLQNGCLLATTLRMHIYPAPVSRLYALVQLVPYPHTEGTSRLPALHTAPT